MVPLRSFLFVPSDSSRKLASARNLRPDAFIYDLEDAVSVDRKLEARAMLKSELTTALDLAPKVFVRVNAFESPFFADDLLAAICPQVYGVVLPQVRCY